MLKRRHILSCLLCVLLGWGVCGLVAMVMSQDQPRDAWDEVLAAAGLTKETCHFDALDMALYGGGDFQLPFYNALHSDPLRIPSETRIFRQNVLASAASPGDLVSYAAIRLGVRTRRTL